MADALDGVLSEAQRRGFLGPASIGDQRAHSSAFGRAFAPSPGLHVDLGAGGGLPGLVLAWEWPTTQWALVDGMARRTAFLTEAVAELGLAARVEVVTARAEALGRDPAWRGRASVVVARSFGPPAVVAECAAGLLETGGVLVVSEPPGGDAQRWPADGLAQLGLALEEAIIGPPAFVRCRQRAPASARYPRRVGMPAKRPLW